MTRAARSQRNGGTTPVSSDRSARPSNRLIHLLREIVALTTAFTVTVLAGIPATFAAWFLGYQAPTMAAKGMDLNEYTSLVFATGLSVGIGAFLIIAATISAPLLWARLSNPRSLRLLAYLTIQQVSIGVGMLAPVNWPSWYVTWAMAGFGTAAWWAWQQRWRGSGIAPSPLAGILRPELHPGQIWFAVIAGRKETKVRPVLILNPDPNNPSRWLVAYFTTQQPKYDYIDQLYVQVPSGTLRGLPKDNWIAMTDTRALTRNQFRVYTGLAPTWLYQAVCAGHKVVANPLAWTIDELAAGHGSSPFQSALLHALNVHHGDVNSTDGWNVLGAILRLPLHARPQIKTKDADTAEHPSNPA